MLCVPSRHSAIAIARNKLLRSSFAFPPHTSSRSPRYRRRPPTENDELLAEQAGGEHGNARRYVSRALVLGSQNCKVKVSHRRWEETERCIAQGHAWALALACLCAPHGQRGGAPNVEDELKKRGIARGTIGRLVERVNGRMNRGDLQVADVISFDSIVEKQFKDVRHPVSRSLCTCQCCP
jgi:hypothetical protein